MLLLANLAASAAAAPAPWWQQGAPPYALQVPADLARRAHPIWHAGDPESLPQFVMARREFQLAAGKTLRSAVAFVTAQPSPLQQPDPRLATTNLTGDYARPPTPPPSPGGAPSPCHWRAGAVDLHRRRAHACTPY